MYLKSQQLPSVFSSLGRREKQEGKGEEKEGEPRYPHFLGLGNNKQVNVKMDVAFTHEQKNYCYSSAQVFTLIQSRIYSVVGPSSVLCKDDPYTETWHIYDTITKINLQQNTCLQLSDIYQRGILDHKIEISQQGRRSYAFCMLCRINIGNTGRN